jgi:hypothetical protein
MEKNVKDLFERYENLFRTALRDQVDMDEVASSYATAFVAASPGVSVGRNDEHLKQMAVLLQAEGAGDLFEVLAELARDIGVVTAGSRHGGARRLCGERRRGERAACERGDGHEAGESEGERDTFHSRSRSPQALPGCR